jgi:3-oxoacyl-[acyl-carrier-protein] synthase-3
MAISTITGIQIAGMCSLVPEQAVDNQSLAGQFAGDELEKIMQSTGIKSRRIFNEEQTPLTEAVPLCQHLIASMPDECDIGLVIFVTQTPDYPLPGNAVQLQHQLGLGKECVAFDVNLGCSGYVYGLWQAGTLLQGLACQHALLVAGDATSRQFSPENRAVNTLFGDAVSATLLTKADDALPMTFDLGSDGAGAPYLIQPHGGLTAPTSAPEMHMDGTQVFAFTLRQIPRSIQACLAASQQALTDIDYVVLHQANSMMLRHLADKLGVSDAQLVLALSEYGNTSSASIPLAITAQLQAQMSQQHNTLLLCGFGVGWSWATAVVKVPTLSCCELIQR